MGAGPPFAFVGGAGELEVCGLDVVFVLGFCGLEEVVGFGNGRFGTLAAFCPPLPFALSWKRFAGGPGLAVAPG